jgi:hypothetical protein
MRKKAVSPAQRQALAQEVVGQTLCSQRQACRFLKLARSTFNYHGRPPTPAEEHLRKRLMELSAEHPRVVAASTDAPIINVWDKAGERKSSLSLDWPISSHSRFRHYFTLRPCIAASYGSMKAVWVVNKISQTKVEKLATLVLTNQKGQR